MSNEKELPNGMKLVFAPGCFDNFEGTQEELDELVKEIEDAFTNGDALTNARALDPKELLESLSEDELAELLAMVEEIDKSEDTEVPITRQILH